LTLIIDASIAIKWVVPELGSAEALSLRRTGLVAPDLLIPECANVLWKKVRRGELTEAEALLGARLLERAGVQLEPMRPLLEAATRLAVALDHPAYDCMYLALASTMDCEFVTADRRFYRKAVSNAAGRRVRLLGVP
jgi:predicted nucleic acid-binding protein